MPLVSYPRRLRELAEADPDRPAVTCDEVTLTRAGLEMEGTRLAHHLATLGVGQGDFVTVALPNSVDWVVGYVAIWKLGATPQPVSSRLPQRELQAIVELAAPKVILGAEPGSLGDSLADVPCLPLGFRPPEGTLDEPLPDITSAAWKAPTSGGSTGRPKLIVTGDAAEIDDAGPSQQGFTDGGCLVMPGPLYHNGPAMWVCAAILAGSHAVILPRFDAEATLRAIEEHGGTVLYTVPTMMKRISALPDEVRDRYDVSTLQLVWHLAEPCPPWLKQTWIDWLGAERIIELYAGTEAQAVTIITGPEWVEHRGSVGRVALGEMTVRNADGNEVPAGTEGEIWMRSTRGTPTYRYVGAEARALPDGWESLGDMGWFDEDGYLYLGDRMADMILIGGANVYPAEVEAVMLEHPAVRSAIVVGLPDEDKGNVIHAIVEADRAAVPESELLAFLAERLVRYKLPRTVEYVDGPLRDDAGKARRSALRDERL